MSGSPPGDRLRGPGRGAPGPRSPQDLNLLAILGPTGTGKSELAFELALELGGEIINCDALQVYLGFDAATAKPPVEFRRRVTHHVVDCVDPRIDFNVARFVDLATAAIADVSRRGRVPIVAGGTGMYLRGLMRGVVSSPVRDQKLRARIHAMGDRHGASALHRWLRRLDPNSAVRIPPGDGQRVARAIEFALLEGDTWSQRLQSAGTWRGGKERYRTLKIGLTMDRNRLYARLDERVDRFLEAGLVEEVEGLLASGIPPGANAFKAIGYREVLAAVREGREAESVHEEVKRNTRRFAKRQLTWFRSEPDVEWLDAESEPRNLRARVLELWRRHVALDA